MSKNAHILFLEGLEGLASREWGFQNTNQIWVWTALVSL